MNIQRSNPINISRYGRSRHKSHDFEELSCLRTTESHQSFSPNLGSPSPPETPDSSHCISRIGDYLLLEPLEGDHVFRAAHLHSGEELVCKVSRRCERRVLPLKCSVSCVSTLFRLTQNINSTFSRQNPNCCGSLMTTWTIISLFHYTHTPSKCIPYRAKRSLYLTFQLFNNCPSC